MWITCEVVSLRDGDESFGKLPIESDIPQKTGRENDSHGDVLESEPVHPAGSRL